MQTFNLKVYKNTDADGLSMRLGIREKQILLALIKLRSSRARDLATLIQQAKWPPEWEKVRFPKRRVVISSVCRSLRLLEREGYVERVRQERRKRVFSWIEGNSQRQLRETVRTWYSHPEWHLSERGQIVAADLKMRLKDQLDRKKQEVTELSEFL